MPIEQLVRHGELPKAHWQEGADVSLPRMQELLEFGRQIIADSPYIAVAFTQVPREDLQSIGLTPEAARYIYIGDSEHFDPEISEALVFVQKITQASIGIPWIERCGSIFANDGRRPSMLIIRPEHVLLTGYTLKTGRKHVIPFRKALFDLYSAAVIHHEWAHLESLTALDYPGLMLDIRKPGIWEMMSSVNGFEGEDCFSEPQFSDCFPFLVWNMESKKYDILEADGTISGQLE